MNYEIYLDGELLYYPGDEERTVSNAVLKQALNEADTLEFDIYYAHPLYNSFLPRKSMLQVLKDGEEIFFGEVREATDNLDFGKHIYAVGELAFLFDSIQPQAKYQEISPYNLFRTMVTLHNSQVEERKQFTVGMVTVTDPNDSLYRFTNYEDTLSAIRDKLCDRLDGFLRIRKVNGVRYIDLVTLSDYGKYSNQVIEFGENLLEYSCNTSAQDIATALIPLGARQDESVIEGLDAYLTIDSVNGGKDYIYNETAVNNFGWVKVVKHWDDITLPENLLKAAKEWLTSAQYAQMTLELNAVDLSILDTDIESIEVGDRVQAVAEPFGMDTVFPLQKKVTYLQDPSKNYITLGNTMQKSYTKQASKAVTELQEEMPQQNSILQIAKENATAMLTGANGGHVLFGINEEGQINEIFITDHLDKTKAQKVWRWNVNGLGYSSTGINGTYGLAITADGSIVADFITTGVLNAALVKAGVLQDTKTGGLIFKLDLDKGTLNGNFESLTIQGADAATKKYAEDAASNAVDDQTQEDIFNKLTDNGKAEGIYLKDGKLYVNASYIDTGTLAAGLIKTGILQDKKGQFSLNMETGALTMNSGTFKGKLEAASGTFSGELSAATGSFKGKLEAATGTISDGTGTLSISSGNLEMTNSKSGGAGVFVRKKDSNYYACWGAKNSAARNDDSYREVSTMDVIKAGENASDERLKTGIKDLDLDFAKDLVFGLQPKEFRYKVEPDELLFGVIAQDVKRIEKKHGITERNRLCYVREMDGMYAVEYKQLIAPMIKVLQDQQKQIEQLKEKINGNV